MNIRQRMAELRAVMGFLHGSRAFGGPFQAELGLTNRCNIRCIHCYYHSPYLERPSLRPVRRARLSGQELPSHEELKRIQLLKADTEKTSALIDELIEMGTRRFQFSGSGETFLHENAIEFMGRTKRAGCSSWALTAGHMFDQEKIDALIGMKLDELRITLMAGTREMYLHTHPGSKESTFDDLRENLLYLTERKKAMKMSKPILNLFFVVISENVNGLMEFAEFASQVQANGVCFRPFDDVADPGLAKLIPSTEQALYVRKQLEEVRPFLESHGIKHNIGNFLKAFERKLDTSALYHAIPCYYVWLVVRIEPDGILFPCCRCSTSPGNVFEKGIREIWNGEVYRHLRKEAHTINTRKTPVTGCTCNSCVNYTANLRVYRNIHPIRGRSKRIQDLSP